MQPPQAQTRTIGRWSQNLMRPTNVTPCLPSTQWPSSEEKPSSSKTGGINKWSVTTRAGSDNKTKKSAHPDVVFSLQVLLATPPPDARARADAHQVHVALHPQQGGRCVREPRERSSLDFQRWVTCVFHFLMLLSFRISQAQPLLCVSTGIRMWALNGYNLVDGYPKYIHKLGFPKTVRKVDAAVHIGETGKTLFFTDEDYWRCVYVFKTLGWFFRV